MLKKSKKEQEKLEKEIARYKKKKTHKEPESRESNKNS